MRKCKLYNFYYLLCFYNFKMNYYQKLQLDILASLVRTEPVIRAIFLYNLTCFFINSLILLALTHTNPTKAWCNVFKWRCTLQVTNFFQIKKRAGVFLLDFSLNSWPHIFTRIKFRTMWRPLWGFYFQFIFKMFWSKMGKTVFFD